jgi:hypothetical protein
MSTRLAALCLVALAIAVPPGCDLPDSRAAAVSAAEAAGPCADVSGSPGGPGDEPDPLIAGTISHADTHSPVAGATVHLFHCQSGNPTPSGTTATDDTGAFRFAGLPAPAWYYVAVDLTGPLSGLRPAGDTVNPTAPVAIGVGSDTILLTFR